MIIIRCSHRIGPQIAADHKREPFNAIGTEKLEYYFQDDSKVIPVHLKSAFWVEASPGERMSVSVLSDRGQSISVPVTVSISDAGSCAYAELTWSSLGYFLLSHWQELLLMALTAVICYFVTKAVFQGSVRSLSSSC